MRRGWLITVIFISSLQLNVQGQNNEDLQLWTSASVKTKLAKGWTAVAEQGLRLGNNWSQLSTTYSELGIRYKYNKHWTFKVAYRFGQPTNPDLPIHHDHRYVVDVRYREDWNLDIMDIQELEINFRFRYQSRYRDIFVSEDGRIPTNYLRGKLTFVLDLDNIIEPSFGAEWFYRLKYDGNFFDAYRLFISLDWAIDAKHALGFTLMREMEFNVERPENINVLGINYSYKLDYLFEKDRRYHRGVRWL